MTRRRPRASRAPLAWALGLTAAGTALIAFKLKPANEPVGPANGPASATTAETSPPPRAAPRAVGAALRWRILGVGLPPQTALANCLDANLDASVRVDSSSPDSVTVTWSAAASPLVLTRLEGPALDVETPLDTASSAHLRAHAAALTCLRPEATRLIDLDLGRTFDAATFRAGSRPGAVDPELFFGVEALNGSLVTRGLARFTGYELEVVPDAARGWPQARSVALSAVSVLVAQGGDAGERPLVIGDYGRFTLSAVEAPPGIERVVRLAPLDPPQAAAPSPTPALSPRAPRAHRRPPPPSPQAPTLPPSLPDYR